MKRKTIQQRAEDAALRVGREAGGFSTDTHIYCKRVWKAGRRAGLRDAEERLNREFDLTLQIIKERHNIEMAGMRAELARLMKYVPAEKLDGLIYRNRRV